LHKILLKLGFENFSNIKLHNNFFIIVLRSQIHNSRTDLAIYLSIDIALLLIFFFNFIKYFAIGSSKDIVMLILHIKQNILQKNHFFLCLDNILNIYTAYFLIVFLFKSICFQFFNICCCKKKLMWAWYNCYA
jgi:hypothetical protein